MSKHTPGPWKVESDGSSVTMANQVTIVGPAPDWADRATETANARLIAAAPDLLEALRRIRDLPTGETIYDHWRWSRKIADEAIAKAEGDA